MALHARNVAVSAGVPPNLVEAVANMMRQHKQITTHAALEFLAAKRKAAL